MKIVEKHKWRIRWAGRWKTTTEAWTEEHIRREHPEAERVPNSMVAVQVAETEEEIEAHMRPARRGK